jgi:hypothetical protein
MSDNRNITQFKMNCTKFILCLNQIIIKPKRNEGSKNEGIALNTFYRLPD